MTKFYAIVEEKVRYSETAMGMLGVVTNLTPQVISLDAETEQEAIEVLSNKGYDSFTILENKGTYKPQEPVVRYTKVD